MEEYPTVIVYMRTDDAVTPCDTLGPKKVTPSPPLVTPSKVKIRTSYQGW